MDGRGTENKPEDLHSESLSWLEAPWGEYYNSPPPPMDGRGTENKREGLHSESLSWLEAPWSEYYNSTHHPTAPSCMDY